MPKFLLQKSKACFCLIVNISEVWLPRQWNFGKRIKRWPASSTISWSQLLWFWKSSWSLSMVLAQQLLEHSPLQVSFNLLFNLLLSFRINFRNNFKITFRSIYVPLWSFLFFFLSSSGSPVGCLLEIKDFGWSTNLGYLTKPCIGR